ncbi:MAG TPA: ribosome-associated translation inhibitor RaiA [Opitutaceae bacterium]|nr:ribosome-associated translation inhibitor RaiA [Opitutaceae bacterium]
MATSPDNNDTSRIHMAGIHVDLTPSMQEHIRDKFSILLRHNEWIIRVDIRLHMDQSRGKHHHYTATGQLQVRGPDIVASVKGDDAYNVLDGLVEKLDELLRERHERVKDKRNHPRDIEIDAPLPKLGGE